MSNFHINSHYISQNKIFSKECSILTNINFPLIYYVKCILIIHSIFDKFPFFFCIFQSLGKLKNRPYKDKSTGKIVLEYSHGSQCPHDPHKNASTRIVFSCNPGPDQVFMMLLKLLVFWLGWEKDTKFYI